MWGVALAYAAIAYCYFCVAFGGYWAFGNGVASNIMLSVERPHWLVAVANLLVVIHVFGSYQVCSACPAWIAFIGSCVCETQMHNAQVCRTDALARWF